MVASADMELNVGPSVGINEILTGSDRAVQMSFSPIIWLENWVFSSDVGNMKAGDTWTQLNLVVIEEDL